MGTLTLLGIVLAGVWTAWSFLFAKQPSSVTPIPLVPQVNEVKSEGAPRWHKYDVLLELQECLRKSGVDEKKVLEICGGIAPLLLGEVKHE